MSVFQYQTRFAVRQACSSLGLVCASLGLVCASLDLVCASLGLVCGSLALVDTSLGPVLTWLVCPVPSLVIAPSSFHRDSDENETIDECLPITMLDRKRFQLSNRARA